MPNIFLSLFSKAQKKPKWAETYLNFIDELQDGDTIPDTEQPTSYDDNDILGQSFGMGYISATGEKTDRWISVIGVAGKDKDQSLLAYCFVRERPRQFRLDRITTIYDADGIVSDCEKFFASYGLSYKSNPPPLQKKGAFLKRKMKHEARILVAIARIDGNFKEVELEEILIYCVKKMENKGDFQSDEDIAAFEKYLRNLYPTYDVLEKCLSQLVKYTDRGKKDFLLMCTRVMDADNIQKQSEFDLILEIKNALIE